MIKKFSKYLSDYFIKIGIVERKNKSWCQYVIEKKAIRLIFGMATLIFSLYIKKTLEIALFLIIFCSIRKHIGGWHASSPWKFYTLFFRRKGGISYEMQNGLFDSFNPEVVQDYFANGEPFASLDPSYMTVGLLRQCAALGIKTVTLPIPNELGGVTAEIGSYAMGNRNTKHPVEVKALLAYLLSEECQSSSAFADKDMFPVRRGCFKKCMEAQYQFSVYDASHEKIGQEDIENRKEMYGDNLTDAQLDQLETICDKINAAQYHTIWYRALQLDQSEDGGNLLSETMVQYWNDEITLGCAFCWSLCANWNVLGKKEE